MKFVGIFVSYVRIKVHFRRHSEYYDTSCEMREKTGILISITVEGNHGSVSNQRNSQMYVVRHMKCLSHLPRC
jgi:hypothetical protein